MRWTVPTTSMYWIRPTSGLEIFAVGGPDRGVELRRPDRDVKVGPVGRRDRGRSGERLPARRGHMPDPEVHPVGSVRGDLGLRGGQPHAPEKAPEPTAPPRVTSVAGRPDRCGDDGRRCRATEAGQARRSRRTPRQRDPPRSRRGRTGSGGSGRQQPPPAPAAAGRLAAEVRGSGGRRTGAAVAKAGPRRPRRRSPARATGLKTPCRRAGRTGQDVRGGSSGRT